jgi:hypothetical protein
MTPRRAASTDRVLPSSARSRSSSPPTPKWVADVPATTALALGIAPDRRPSEAMIRGLLQALDPDLLTKAISGWFAARSAVTRPAHRRAVVVDGKTLRGSRTADIPARHVMTAYDQVTGAVLASTDVSPTPPTRP